MKARVKGQGIRIIAGLFTAAALVAVLAGGSARAGEAPTLGPDSPRLLGSATLQNLYDRLNSGSNVLSLPAGSTFAEPASGPTTPTMKTVDEILAVAPRVAESPQVGAAAAEVCVNRVFWSLLASPNWGLKSGSMDCTPPTFSSTPGASVNEDSAYSYTPTVSETATVTVVTAPSFLTLSGGVLSGTPSNANVGAHPVVLKAVDGGGWTAVQSWTLTVVNVNDAPTAAADSLAAYEQVPATINVLANDTDPDAVDTLAVTANTTPGHGTVTRSGGLLTYTGEADYSGTDTFDYTLSDGHTTVTGTVTVTVNDINDAPSFTIANPVQSTTLAGGAQVVDNFASSVSLGPAYETGQSAAFTVVSCTSTGIFDVQPAVSNAGRLTYTPKSTGSGGISVCELRLSDGGGTAWGGTATSTQRFFISIQP